MENNIQDNTPSIPYSQLLQLLPTGIGIFLVDLEKNIIHREYMNDGYFAMLGSSREERKAYAGTHVMDTVLDEDKQKIWDELQHCLQENRPFSCAFRLLFDNGRYRWVLLNATHIPVQGDQVRFFATLYDIHELAESRQKAEKQIADERLRMKTMADGILAVSCFNVTRDTNIDIALKNLPYDQPVSPALEQAALQADPTTRHQNKETKTILLAAAQQIPDSTQRQKFLATCSHTGMKKLYEQGKREVHLEYRRHTRKGLLWVHTRIALLPDPATGDVLAFFYTTDINEQKIRQEILNKLIDQFLDFATFLDTKTNIVKTIKTTDGILATPPDIGDYDAINAAYIPRFVHPEDQALCYHQFNLDYIKKRLSAEPVLSIYYRMIDPKKPDTHPLHMRMYVSYLNDEKQYIVFSRLDVSEQVAKDEDYRRKLEESVKQAENANAAKTNFLARMSHDIRTPLNGIMGMTALALDEKLSPMARNYLEKIDESSHFLLSLINDILDMSKVESGKVELHPERYVYKELQDYLTAVIQPLCTAKDIHFTITYPPATYTLLADKIRFNQILFNLLSNAVKFTHRGGHIWLDFKVYDITEKTLTMDTTIRDDGIGMSKEFQKRLFRPFEQEHNDSTSIRTGSGLGLAIVKNLLDLMNGKIHVTSTYGKGSEFVFTLTLPILPDLPTTEKSVPTDISLEGKHILIAEDNDLNGEIMMTLLQKKGALTTLAIDGELVVKQYADSDQYYYDAILMDIQMPRKNGLQATRDIRKLNRPDAKTIPIIAMTANAFDDDVQACIDAGMNAHLGKPIETDLLFQVLLRWIGKTQRQP